MRLNMLIERKKSGLKAEEIAALVGVTANAIWDWERGDKVPLASNLLRLAQVYGCQPEYLLEDTAPGEDPS